jgi:3-oxoacyl-[acyl-carrier-protein] synthase-3
LLILSKTELKASDIDGIIFGTVTPSYLSSPPDSTLLQDRLGIPPTNNGALREFHCIDCSLACSTWIAALKHAYFLISSGHARNILVIGADKMSDTINWRDRAFATILGDAGTATWCAAVDPGEDWFSQEQFWNWANGRDNDIILTPKGGSKYPINSMEDISEYRNRLTMDGAMVKDIIVPLVGGPAIEAALGKAGWSIDSLELATLHEANLILNRKIIDSWKKKGFNGRVLDAGGMYGNTTSATIPLALALNGHELKVGRKFIWSAFGGGLTVSMVLGEIKNEVQTFLAV